MIDGISDHYIVCGFGRVGRQVTDEFRAAGVPFVVLDFNPEVLEIAREQNVPYIDGSGTNDEDLEAAGLARARGLVACSDSDVDNLYITVSARAERPDMQIVARASTEDAATKMLPRRRRPRRAAVLLGRPGDREADADAVGVGVPRHRLAARRPRSPLRGARDHGALPAGRPHDPRDPRPARHRRADRRAEEGGRDLRHDAGPGRGAERRRRADRRRHRRTSCALEELFAPRRQLPARAITRARGALARLPERGRARAPVRGRARRLRDERRAAARAGAEALAAGARARSSRRPPPSCPTSSGPRSRARGSSTCSSPTRGSRRRSPRSLEPGFGGGFLERRERVQVEMVSANPTGPIVVSAARNGAIGDSLARLLELGGDEVEREYYYNDAGAQMEQASASRSRRSGAGRTRPRTATRATTSASSRQLPATRCRRCSSRSSRRSSASASTSTRGRCRASWRSGCRSCCPRLDTYEQRRRRLGALVRVRRRAGPGDPPLARPASRPTAPPTSSTSWTSSSAASTARSTSSAPTTTARATGTRRSRGCSATTPSGSRCCSTSSST